MLNALSSATQSLALATSAAAALAFTADLTGARRVRAAKGPVSAKERAAKKRAKSLRKAGRQAAKRGR